MKEPKKSNDLENTPAGVPEQHSEPGQPVVEDKAEEATEFAEAVEGGLEEAASRNVLGGPMGWAMIALAVVVAILAIAMS